MWSASTFAHTHTNTHTHRHTDEDPQRNANNIEFHSYSCSHFRCLDFKVRFLFPPYLSLSLCPSLSYSLSLSGFSLFIVYTFCSCFVFFYSFLFRIWWHISGSVLLIFRSIFGLVVHAPSETCNVLLQLGQLVFHIWMLSGQNTSVGKCSQSGSKCLGSECKSSELIKLEFDDIVYLTKKPARSPHNYEILLAIYKGRKIYGFLYDLWHICSYSTTCDLTRKYLKGKLTSHKTSS